MKSRRIEVTMLVPGMILAESAYNMMAQLIVPKGTVITDKLITRFEFYGLKSVAIEEKIEEDFEENITDSSYFEKVKTTTAFKEFQSEFVKVTDECEFAFNDIVEHNNIMSNVNYLLNSTTNLLNKGRTSLDVFDMLHSMREMDNCTYTHSVNVALIAAMLGRWLKMNEDDVEVLILCGLMHDIGKLLVPKEILLKPGKLTDEEYYIIKKHPSRGYDLLKTLPIDQRVINSCLCHHEHCDGTGYPNRLKSNEIDDFAKIISIADVYDAMTAARVYRGPLCPFEVLALFETEGYSFYEPKFLIPFLRNVVMTYMHATVLLSNGKRGEIVMLNKNSPLLPVIRCGNDFVDLSKENGVKITAMI